MAHGFSATRTMALDAYAQRFADVGLAVLAYDHRNLGASDGEPRQEINPWAQTRDFLRAVDWLGARVEVDAERIGLWGSSYSGGEVVVAAAADRRVRAVVANVPFVGLPGVDYSTDLDARADALLAALADSSAASPADTVDDVLGPFAVVDEEGVDLPAFLNDPAAPPWFLGEGRRPGSGWVNRVTVAGIRSTPSWDPGVCVHRVAPTPLLLLVALEDALVDAEIAIAAHARAGSTAEIVFLEGHHFAPYSGAGFDRAAGAAADWFLRGL